MLDVNGKVSVALKLNTPTTKLPSSKIDEAVYKYPDIQIRIDVCYRWLLPHTCKSAIPSQQMDVTDGRRIPQSQTLKSASPVKKPPYIFFFRLSNETSRPAAGFEREERIQQLTRCGVEVAAPQKAALFNKVEQRVDPSTAEDYTPFSPPTIIIIIIIILG